MEIDVCDKVETYVLIFYRSITLEYSKTNEVTFKPPVGLLCLSSFIRAEFFIAKFVRCCPFRRDQILWNKSRLGKFGSLFPQLVHLYGCLTTKNILKIQWRFKSPLHNWMQVLQPLSKKSLSSLLLMLEQRSDKMQSLLIMSQFRTALIEI